jgi:carbon monoxide dehydrogenase subunit G
MGRAGRPIVARRRIAASQQDVIRFLEDLENHARLAPCSVEVLSHDGGYECAAHAIVRLRGPLGIRRLAQTELQPVRAGASSIRGRARIGNRTAATVSWTIRDRGGISEATLCAAVEEAGPLDWVLLRLGAGRWLARRFAAALERLSDELASTAQQSARRASAGLPTSSPAEPVPRWS